MSSISTSASTNTSSTSSSTTSASSSSSSSTTTSSSTSSSPSSSSSTTPTSSAPTSATPDTSTQPTSDVSTSPPTTQSFSTAVQTTIITTESGGAILTIQTTITPTSLPTSTTPSHHSSAPIGAIVGGTVGGVVGILLLVLVLVCLRRRNHWKDDFDGNFDPDSVAGGHYSKPSTVGRGDGADLVGEERNVSAVEPFVLPSVQTPASGFVGGFTQDGYQRQPQQQYYNQQQQQPVGAQQQYGGYYYDQQSTAPTTTHSTLSSPTTNSQSQLLSVANPHHPMSAKEREAFSRAQSTSTRTSGSGGPVAGTSSTPLHVANAEGGPSGSGVIVHKDGGRVQVPPEEPEPEAPKEIPPSYDSISQGN